MIKGLQELQEALNAVNKAKANLHSALERQNDTGAGRISTERERQVWDEGFTNEHDDVYTEGQLAVAGGCYAFHSTEPYVGCQPQYRNAPPPADWPWRPEWWKPKSPFSDLKKAGALMAAEIDRRKRLLFSGGDNERS